MEDLLYVIYRGEIKKARTPLPCMLSTVYPRFGVNENTCIKNEISATPVS
jgi:hypothetical protein